MKLLERTALRTYDRFLARDNPLTRLLVRRSRFVYRIAFASTIAAYPGFCAMSWVGTLSRRALGKKPRVVWGPVPILTIAESSNLLRRLGYPSTTVVYTTYHITSDFDVNLKEAMTKHGTAWWLPNFVYLWSLLRFDVFHQFFDGGLWTAFNQVPHARWLELPLLRLAGKRVIASAYGADVRVRHLNELWQPFNICRDCPAPGTYCVCGTHGLTRTKYHRDWCNELLAMGDMHDFVFDSRNDFNYWPVDVDSIDFAGAVAHEGPVRVVHSPTQRFFKGTRYIEEAIASLRSRGHDVELDVVEGVSNAEARARYARADIVCAQCLAGWIGYTELEAMAAGKPVVSYLRSPAYLAHTNGSPLVSASPGTLEAELERLVVDPARREELGRRGREYVEREWSHRALARPYDELHARVWEDNGLRRTIRSKVRDFRRGETGYRVGHPLDGSELREWPVFTDPQLNLRRFERGVYGQPPFDENGIPRTFSGGRYVEHPGVVALFGINAFHLSLAEPHVDRHRERFDTAAHWLRDRLVVDREGVGRWLHEFEASPRDVAVPWVSASTQSLGLSNLLRGAKRYPEEGFGEAAEAAAELFRTPVSEHGVLCDEDGLTYLEQYPESEPAHDLDGFVTAIFGLHEFVRVTGATWAAELRDRCIETVRRTLDRYETRSGVRYDQKRDEVVPPESLYFQVQQLEALHAITGDRAFSDRGRRWARRLYWTKTRSFLLLRAPI